MPNQSVRALLAAFRSDRSRWPRGKNLPVLFHQPVFVAHTATNVPKNVQRVITSAADSTDPGYLIQAVLRATLKSYGASVRTQLDCCVNKIQFKLQVGMVGYIKGTLRVVFLDVSYTYGNPCPGSSEELRWNSERDTTELQLNELVAIILAAQRQLHTQPVELQEILVIFPSPKNDKIFWTSFTPTTAMLVTPRNLSTPVATVHLRNINSVGLSPGMVEIYNLVRSFLGEPAR